MSNVKEPKPVSAFLLFKQSYMLIIKNLQIFILIGGLGLVAQFVTSLQIKIPENGGQFPTISKQGAGIFAVALICSIVLYTMAVKLQVLVAQNKKPSFGILWEFARDYTFKILGLGFIISCIVFTGLIAFIIPGLIFIRRYILAPYVMADKGTGIMDSMRISAELSKPFSSAVWGVIGVSILISLISVVGQMGSLVSAILAVCYSVAPALRYEELKKLI